MERRLLKAALLTIVLSAAAAGPAWAANNQNNGNGGEHGNSEGKGNSDNAGSSNAGGNSDGSSNAGGDKAANKADEDLALEAVRAEDAMPLEQILETVRDSTSGRVIDARLFSLNGVLVYEVKLLSSSGQVTRYYYYAGSGKQFIPN